MERPVGKAMVRMLESDDTFVLFMTLQGCDFSGGRQSAEAVDVMMEDVAADEAVEK